MAALTNQQQQELYEWVKLINWSVGRGAPIIDTPGKMEAITYWAERVSKLLQDIARRVDISPAEVAAIAAAVPRPPSAADNSTAFLATLDGRTPEQVADALRAVLGSQAVAVGRLLVGSSG